MDPQYEHEGSSVIKIRVHTIDPIYFIHQQHNVYRLRLIKIK